jgi:hypothetical protein
MNSLVRIIVIGAQMFGRSFVEAWKQAGKSMPACQPVLTNDQQDGER